MVRVLAAIILMLSAGCELGDVETVYVDPPITVGNSGAVEAVPGDPTLRIGFVRPDGFEPLTSGGPLWVVWGTQGGYWTMPALRVIGVGTPARVSCQVVTALGEEVGRLNTRMRLFPVPGYLEASAVPINIRHAGAAPEDVDLIDDLYGLDATFSCTVTDSNERAASLSVAVVLTEG